MPPQRIAEPPIAELKSWMAENEASLAARGINRIDGYYTDDDLDAQCIDEIRACHQDHSMITRVEPGLSSDELSELTDYLDALVWGPDFFQGQQGNKGDIRLLFGIHPTKPGLVIELQPQHYVTELVNEEVELY